MGTAIYIQGYEKKAAFISGEIRILGWYEVNTDEIEKYKLDNTFAVISDELKSISHAMQNFWEFGLEDPSQLTFLLNIMNNISGAGYRYEDEITYGLMFDGVKILFIIEKVLDSIDSVPLNPSDKETEKENLIEMQKVLKIIAAKKGMVGIMLG